MNVDPKRSRLVYDKTGVTSRSVGRGVCREYGAGGTVKVVAALLMFSFAAGAAQGSASVRDFGAKGDGVTDDTKSLQAAINATPAGTLNFPAGNYRVTSTLTLLSNVTYVGQNGSTLASSNGLSIMQLPGNPSGITLTGLTFDGGGLRADGAPGMNITITGNTFQNITTRSGNWTLRTGIFSSRGFRNSSIDHNRFKNLFPAGSTRPDGTIQSIGEVNIGIISFGLDQTSIDHNTFDSVGEGMKLCFSQTYDSHNVYIGYNVMTGIHRMGIEIQGAIGCGSSQPSMPGPDTHDIVIESNSITNYADPYWDSFGISYANPVPFGGDGAIIRKNLIVVGPTFYWNQQGAGGNYAAAIEAAGGRLQVYGNVIAAYASQAITIDGAPNALIHDNFSCALGKGARMDVGPETGPSAGASYFSNTIESSCPAQLPSISKNEGRQRHSNIDAYNILPPFVHDRTSEYRRGLVLNQCCYPECPRRNWLRDSLNASRQFQISGHSRHF